jgi:hypothetical protein
MPKICPLRHILTSLGGSCDAKRRGVLMCRKAKDLGCYSNAITESPHYRVPRMEGAVDDELR